ncbi:MAG: T9SS type A sorting domain-containing protein [Saprospiraceae bacterium]
MNQILLAPIVGLCLFASWLYVEPDAERVAVNSRHAFGNQVPLRTVTLPADSTLRFEALTLCEMAYDPIYSENMSAFMQLLFPMARIESFKGGNVADLAYKLKRKDVVLAPYLTLGDTARLRQYGIALKGFVQQGGLVVVTGTHDFEALQALDLFDLDYGFWKEAPRVCEQDPYHPIFQGLDIVFEGGNFAYPLELNDPGFRVLAEVASYPVIGYKQIGKGRVVYLGLEYYAADETALTLLRNVMLWAFDRMPAPSTGAPALLSERNATQPSSLVENDWQGLLTRKMEAAAPEAKVFPNPYAFKAQFQIELKAGDMLGVEMTDENGRSVAVLHPYRETAPGIYTYDLPQAPPGIYYLKYNTATVREVRKVVKVAAP